MAQSLPPYELAPGHCAECGSPLTPLRLQMGAGICTACEAAK